MDKVRKPRVKRRQLEPAGWCVRAAFSPFSTGWGGQWWSLLICDEGLAAFQWPTRKYLIQVLRVGLRAGAAHMPTTIAGDSWPLSVGSNGQESPAVELFSSARLEAIEVKRSRFLWSHVRVRESDQRWRTFTMVDPGLDPVR